MFAAALILIFTLFSPFIPSVFAAERISVSAPTSSGSVGEEGGVEVQIKLLEGSHDGASPSIGEKAELIVRDARAGDECKTNPSPSDASGTVIGTCYAAKPGSMIVYAKSKDRGDQSSDTTLDFEQASEQEDSAESGSKNTPQKLTPQQEAQYRQLTGQSASTNQADILTNQPGLMPDQPSNGLSEDVLPSDTSPSVQGTNTAAGNDPKSDLDLLNSIIFLVSGIIFLIGGIYFLWLQIRERETKKKKTGAPPQPPIPTPPVPPIPPMDTPMGAPKPPTPSTIPPSPATRVLARDESKNS